MALLLVPYSEHLMVTGQEPAVVRVPTLHVQLTEPPEPAVLGPSPAALDGPDLYWTTIEQAAPGEVRAAAVA